MSQPRLPTIAAPEEPKLAYPDLEAAAPDQISLIRGSTFFTATHQGDLMPPGAPHVGLFFDDTRFLSRLELRVNGQQPSVLSATTADADMASIDMTVRGGRAAGENLDLPVNTVYLHRRQALGKECFYDTLELRSFYSEEVTLRVELAFASDFMDIFQVRGLLRGKAGTYYEPQVSGDTVRLLYHGLDGRTRQTELHFSPSPAGLDGGCARWELRLAPHAVASISAKIHMAVDPVDGSRAQEDIPIEEALEVATRQHDDWLAGCTRFSSDNDIFNAMLRTSTEDFYALRMPEACGVSVAAGVPWFAALFGRDSLISSYETLLLNPAFARGTLCVLAGFQGTERNDERDEDPGKILHERRSGEMTNTGEVAFGRSYGSVDATPLFLILAGEYYAWTADLALLRQLREPILAAVRWLTDYADLDGDGLIEYCRRNPKGLFNQGWKDSGDANRHVDGSIAEPPIALIEVQGYAVRALESAARLLEQLGEHEVSEGASTRAKELRRLIDERFWLPEQGIYAMALDRDKQPLRVEASNPGHLLFSGAVTEERGRQVAASMMGEGLFSGWGIRTLSCETPYYNPMSYHCGSVWPHDNAVIGYGLARYGLHAESAKVFQALYDTALHFRDYRLPELFCGMSRHGSGEPVRYPVSCSPQAWAAGAPFLLLTGLLGIRPDAAAGELAIVDPHLPPSLRRLRIENLCIGGSRVALEFERDGDRTHCNVLAISGAKLKVSVVFSPVERS